MPCFDWHQNNVNKCYVLKFYKTMYYASCNIKYQVPFKLHLISHISVRMNNKRFSEALRNALMILVSLSCYLILYPQIRRRQLSVIYTASIISTTVSVINKNEWEGKQINVYTNIQLQQATNPTTQNKINLW